MCMRFFVDVLRLDRRLSYWELFTILTLSDCTKTLSSFYIPRYEVFDTPGELYIVTEYAQGGELFELI
jgi:hypothetical protein